MEIKTKDLEYSEIRELLAENGFETMYAESIITITHKTCKEFIIEVDFAYTDFGRAPFKTMAQKIIKEWNKAIDYQEENRNWNRPYVYIPNLFNKER